MEVKMGDKVQGSILTEPVLANSKKRILAAMQSELDRNAYPRCDAVLNEPLSVSFPSQAGVTANDLEKESSRQPLGRAYSIAEECGSFRKGIVAILLLKSPIFIVAEGIVLPSRVQVIYNDAILGEVNAQPHSERFYLNSQTGSAEIEVSATSATVITPNQKLSFPLQLDLDRILRPFKRLTNPNVVYQPALNDCDPIVVLGFLLALRMIYRRNDF